MSRHRSPHPLQIGDRRRRQAPEAPEQPEEPADKPEPDLDVETRLVENWVKCETGVYAENTGTTPARLQIQLAVILEADMLVSSMPEVIVPSGQTYEETEGGSTCFSQCQHRVEVYTPVPDPQTIQMT